MASTATMQAIWEMLKTFYLTSSNERWLADKLIVSAAEKEKTYSKEDQEILDGFREAIHELKEIKAGRAQTISDEEFVAEIRRKEAAGYYD